MSIRFYNSDLKAGDYDAVNFEGLTIELCVLACLCAISFFYLSFRNSGVYPGVFADEYIYSKFARLLPLTDSSIPSYIYLYIYSFTSYCGDGFRECVKLFNAFFFVAAIPFVYLVARRVTGRSTSMAASLLTALSPINSYTAYFMPESLYFLCFWVLAWSVLRIDAAAFSIGQWFLVGVTLGASSLVKPHALFLIPAILIYILYVAFKQRVLLTVKLLKVILVAVGTTVGTKFLIGYIFAGESGLTLFGSFYGSVVDNTSADGGRYVELLAFACESLEGHLKVIVLLYGFPLVFGVSVILRRFLNFGSISEMEKLSVFFLVVIFSLVVVVAVFTASVAGAGLYETPYRLHIRYYSFALPAFVIISFGSLKTSEGREGNTGAYVVGACVVVVALCTVYSNISPYTPGHVDSPQLWGIYSNYRFFLLFSGLSIMAVCFWFVAANLGARIYVFAALPLLVGGSAFFINQEQRSRLEANVYDRAGIFTRYYFSSDEVSKVIVVGSDISGLYRTLYYLDNAEASFEVIPEQAVLDIREVPPKKEWVVLIGDYLLPKDASFLLPLNGFTLLRVTDAGTLDFRRSNWPGSVFGTRGLSSVEPWGTWSSDDVVAIEFLWVLPVNFELSITAHAFGPNVNQEFVAIVGNSVKEFSLGASTETRTLIFRNVARSRTLRIKVPFPASPKALGLSGDDRRLGIGLVEIRLRPL